MDTTLQSATSAVITPAELLEYWQGHRRLTRKIIEAFPEKELFEYSIGGMRTFSMMVQELLAISGPGLRQMVGGAAEKLNEKIEEANTKENILALWDQATNNINEYWKEMSIERFHEKILVFGQYEGTIWWSIFYFIDNEIHHRAQGYVLLRSLGIAPPPFWER